MKAILIAIIIVAVSMVLLSVRLLAGKKNFVSSHIEDSEAMRQRGIVCAKEQEKHQHKEGLVIKEHL